MEKWEYLTVELQQQTAGKGAYTNKQSDVIVFTDQLNKYGSQGWELVSIFIPSSLHGTTTEGVFAAFKRKINL